MVAQVSWLYLDLNSFFASCEQQENPKLRGRPVGVVPMLVDTTCCIAASYEAKAFGVKTGTLVKDAKKMCPKIQFVQARHEVYIRYNHNVTEVVESCLPIDGVLSIDEMACKLTGSQKSIEAAIELSKKIKKELRSQVGECVTASIGLAPNRFLAKVAADMKKPDGITVLTKEDLPLKLYGLSLRDIPGIGFRMEKRLQYCGVFTVEELCSQSEDQMRVLWGGVWGSRMWKWLRGEDVDLPQSKTRSLGHQHVLEPKLRHAEGVYAVAKKLLVKAAVRLKKNGYYTQRLMVDVKFMGQPSDYWSRQVKFDETQDTLTLLRELEKLWKNYPNKKPLRVGITFSDFVSEEFHQISFFENPKRAELNKVVDSINKKYGKDAVHIAAIHELLESAPTRIAFQRIPDLEEV